MDDEFTLAKDLSLEVKGCTRTNMVVIFQFDFLRLNSV